MSDWPSSIVTPPKPVISTFGRESLGVVAGTASFASTAWPASNRAIYLPFTLDTPYKVQKIAWINGATIGANVDVGIFERDGVRLGSLGAVAQGAINTYQVGDITDIDLDPGVYFMGMVLSLNTGTVSATASLGAPLLRGCGVQQQALAGTAMSTNANPAVFANPASAFLPLMTLYGVATA